MMGRGIHVNQTFKSKQPQAYFEQKNNLYDYVYNAKKKKKEVYSSSSKLKQISFAFYLAMTFFPLLRLPRLTSVAGNWGETFSGQLFILLYFFFPVSM